MSHVSVEISGDGVGGSVLITHYNSADGSGAGIRIHGDPTGPGAYVSPYNGRTYGRVMAEMGELSDGDYGIALVNEAGELVKLQDFIFGPRKNEKSSAGDTSSTSYTNLSDGAGPTLSGVTIGELGRAIVTLTAYMEAPNGGMALMGLEIRNTATNAVVQAPDDIDSLSIGGGSVGSATRAVGRASVEVFVEGLPKGAYTFTAKYRVQPPSGSPSAFFVNRVIKVQPY